MTKEFERIPDDDEDAPADALDYAAAAAAAAAAEDDDDGAGHWSQRSHEEERVSFGWTSARRPPPAPRLLFCAPGRPPLPAAVPSDGGVGRR